MKAYVLVPITIARDFSNSLADGDVYRVAFRPRASVVDNPAFVFCNVNGIFLIQCKPCLIEFIRLDQPIILEDETDDEDDRWDEWQMQSTDIIGGDLW